jgi:hypothetical protein
MRWWLAVLVALVVLGLIGWWMHGRRANEIRRADEPPSRSAAPETSSTRAASPTPATKVLHPPIRSATAHVLVRAGWGAGPGQLGKKIESESAPEGPMSLTVDGHGNLYVLDEINHRVERWSKSGTPLQPISVGGDTAQDLALGKNGSVALLDRLGERNLQLYSADGKPLGEVNLVGKHLPESGGTTGLFTDRDGNFWVEREHQELVRVADANGNSDPDRPTAPGRPTRDGRWYLSGAIADRSSGAVRIRAVGSDGQPAWEVTVSLGAPILYLSLLDSDASGNVYLGGHVGRASAQPPYPIVDEQLVIVGLSPDGAARGMIALPAAPPAAELFRELAVGDDGTLYRMVLGASGVTVETYHL